MEEKDKFEMFNQPDAFDKMLFDYYKNKATQLPLSTQSTIENALNSTKSKEENTTKNAILLKRVAVFVVSLGVITATTVYAKDIVNFISKIFTNSNSGIDKAVDNGYVQNVDMDFIKCGDIGVKVDYLLMDDKNLDISFVYKYYGDDVAFDSMTFGNLTIKDEEDNVLCAVSKNHSDANIFNALGTTVKSSNKIEFLDNTTIRESVLSFSNQFPASQVLHIEIVDIELMKNDNIEYIDGNWNFSIRMDDKFVTRDSYEYSSTESPYVDNITTSLTNTSLSIELKLNTLFDEATLYRRNSIILKDENGNKYRPTKTRSQNINNTEPYSSTITLTYPISTYDNINKLYLHINLDSSKEIDLELSK